MAESGEQLSPHTPVPLAFLICDQVISDEATKKKTLVGVFDRLWAQSFPIAGYVPVTLYVRFIDAEGKYQFKIDYVKSADQRQLAQAIIEAEISDRHTAGEFAVRLPPIPVPEPGEYEFRLWANGRYLHRVRFVASQLPAPGGSP